jgi:hypothetical protein
MSLAGVWPLSGKAKVGELRIELVIKQHIGGLEISKDYLKTKNGDRFRPNELYGHESLNPGIDCSSDCEILEWDGCAHLLLIVQVGKSARCPECNLNPSLPWQNRGHGAEDVVIEALVWHVLVHEQPLDPSLVVLRAVADELHQVRVVHDAQKMNLRHPFVMPLHGRKKNPYIHSAPSEIWIEISATGKKCGSVVAILPEGPRC